MSKLSRQTFVRGDRIVAIFYDIACDDFILLRADGSESRDPHSEYLQRLAGEYHSWFTAVNGYAGVYASTYSHAVDGFIRGVAHG